MELSDYLRIMRRRWKLIVSCLVVATAVAAAVTFQMTPQYASSARLFVSTTPSNTGEAYTGSLFSAQRVTSYADLAAGQELSSRVIDSLGLDMDPAELAANVEATVVPETVILEVSVTDPDPEQAQVLTKAVASELTAYVAELETPPGSDRPLLKASVVDPAVLPTTPVSPKPVRNLGLAAILGLLLGLGLAVLRELLDTTVKNPADAADASESPVMAGINFDQSAVNEPLVTSLSSHAPRVEAFRVLRTNLQFISVDGDSKVFVVTSSLPGEGKSTTATNLAITLAQAGQSVLLIDGDLRRPQVTNMLGMDGSVGLTTALVGKISVEDAVQLHPETGLHVLASGAVPPNPAELLQSHAMHDLLELIRKRFDITIVDAPPLLPVTDAALLASQADGALLVVRHGKTTRDQVRASRDRLNAVEARALGVVLNMVPMKGKQYGYGYGYGYGYAPEADRVSPRRFGFRRSAEGNEPPGKHGRR